MFHDLKIVGLSERNSHLSPSFSTTTHHSKYSRRKDIMIQESYMFTFLAGTEEAKVDFIRQAESAAKDALARSTSNIILTLAN
jgi:hypothetical protein